MFQRIGVHETGSTPILAGYACRKTNRLGPNASSELNRFVVYLALPALLFDIMATTPWHMLDQPAFIAAFGLGAGGSFLLTAMIRLKQSRHLADASLDGLNAAYPNAGFIGLPLCLLAFGHASLAPAVIAMILTVCVLFAVAIVLIELGLQTERCPRGRGRSCWRSSSSINAKPR
ncbi:Membrane transport protein [Burkholderia sp. D7]|nr:Membrane transport protein [Burkholderia sp. D7]